MFYEVVYIVLLLNFALTFTCYALIPEVCASNVTVSKVCCPILQNYGTPCGFPKRGSCKKIEHNNEIIPSVLRIDDRVYWPTRFFTHLCHCNDNYFGISCQDCIPGYIGSDCNERKILVRRNVLSLSSNEKSILKKVLSYSLHTYSNYVIPLELDNRYSDPNLDPTWIKASIQYKKVFDHRFAGRSTLFTSEIDCRSYGRMIEFNHNGVGFLTWHRYMMLDWERELQRIAQIIFGVSEFTLPYWDWTDIKHCDICTNELIGEEGEVDEYGTRISRDSLFYNWTEFCMEPNEVSSCYGCHKAGKIGKLTRSWNSFEFPTLEDVNFGLTQTEFFSSDTESCNSFSKVTEGICGSTSSSRLFMHNKVHNMIDGSMCCSSTSVNDPLFIFHHIQIDRIFQAWYLRNSPSIHDYPMRGEFPGQGRNSYLVGFLPLITHADLFKNTANLGYVYDNYDFSLNRKILSSHGS